MLTTSNKMTTAIINGNKLSTVYVVESDEIPEEVIELTTVGITTLTATMMTISSPMKALTYSIMALLDSSFFCILNTSVIKALSA